MCKERPHGGWGGEEGGGGGVGINNPSEEKQSG